MKKSNVEFVERNTQGQPISVKALRRRAKRENVNLANDKNRPFFEEVGMSLLKYLPTKD